jgi:DNA-directed RNA polymerase II subunit RPB7
MGLLTCWQLIPKDIKFDQNSTPWQWTDNGDQVIEKGAQVRVKLIGTRSDVGAMWAIGSIKEDYLGYVISPWVSQISLSPVSSPHGLADSR